MHCFPHAVLVPEEALLLTSTSGVAASEALPEMKAISFHCSRGWQHSIQRKGSQSGMLALSAGAGKSPKLWHCSLSHANPERKIWKGHWKHGDSKMPAGVCPIPHLLALSLRPEALQEQRHLKQNETEHKPKITDQFIELSAESGWQYGDNTQVVWQDQPASFPVLSSFTTSVS